MVLELISLLLHPVGRSQPTMGFSAEDGMHRTIIRSSLIVSVLLAPVLVLLLFSPLAVRFVLVMMMVMMVVVVIMMVAVPVVMLLVRMVSVLVMMSPCPVMSSGFNTQDPGLVPSPILVTSNSWDVSLGEAVLALVAHAGMDAVFLFLFANDMSISHCWR